MPNRGACSPQPIPVDAWSKASLSSGLGHANDWGRQENHFLRYKLNFAPDFLPLHVTLLSTPEPRGMGRNIPGAGLHVKLAGHGPWQRVEQTLASSPVPTVVPHLKWPEVELVQEVFAAAPEEQGFFVRVTLTNKTAAAGEFELVSLLHNAAEAHGAAAEMVYVAPQLQPAEGARKAGKR